MSLPLNLYGFETFCHLHLSPAGGIQRYIEQFPDGGFFKGKNFVFDERVSVGPAQAAAVEDVGSCLQCAKPCSSYQPRLRCSACRMLVLVCTDCAPQVSRISIGVLQYAQ